MNPDRTAMNKDGGLDQYGIRQVLQAEVLEGAWRYMIVADFWIRGDDMTWEFEDAQRLGPALCCHIRRLAKRA